MKKQLLVFCIMSVMTFTLSPLSRNCPRYSTKKSIDEKCEIAMNQLQKHLEETSFSPQDRNDLINKLVVYFSPSTKKTDIFLKNRQAQIIYGFVIKSYNEIKSSQNNEKNSDKAKKFAEQAVGKILLYKKYNNQKTRTKR